MLRFVNCLRKSNGLSKSRARGPVEACLACAECADRVHGMPLGTRKACLYGNF